MNYKSIPRFPRTWKLFFGSYPNRTSPMPQARCVFSNFISFVFFLLFCALNESLCDPSAISLKSQTWLLHPYRSMANSDLPPGREIYCIPFPFHNSCSRFKRLPKRSQSDSIKATKKKEKAEADKIGKDATGLRQRAYSGWLWSKKSFQVRGNQGIDL